MQYKQKEVCEGSKKLHKHFMEIEGYEHHEESGSDLKDMVDHYESTTVNYKKQDVGDIIDNGDLLEWYSKEELVEIMNSCKYWDYL